MKKLLSLLFLVNIITCSNAQGWIGTDTTTLYPVNAKLKLAPISVGIGTDKPTEQLHTTGSVRFEGLKENTGLDRILVADKNGVLYYDAKPTGGNGNSWLLNGNSVGSTEFIGTTNAQSLRFRTNNTQKAVISPKGYIGINEESPASFLHINGTILVRNNPWETSDLYPNSAQIRIESDPLVNNFPTKPIGAILTFYNRATKNSWEVIQGRNCGARNNDLNFFYYSSDASNCATANPTLTLDKTNVGVNMKKDKMPAANLNVRGTVKLEELPSGTGNILVINNQGDVLKSSKTPVFKEEVEALTTDLTKTKEELARTKDELDQLKQILQALIEKMEDKDKISVNYLLQNTPNPAQHSTIISYNVDPKSSSAKIEFRDANGILIRSIDLKNSYSGNITVDLSGWSPGVYFYALLVNNEPAVTKKMIVQ